LGDRLDICPLSPSLSNNTIHYRETHTESIKLNSPPTKFRELNTQTKSGKKMETARSDSKPKTQVPRSSSSNSDSQSQSPYRFQSPHRSDYGDPLESPPYASPSASPEKSLSPLQNSMAVVAVDTHKSTQYSPAPSSFPPDNLSAPPELVLNKVARERVADGVVRKVGTASVARRSRKEEKMRTGELGFRVSEIIMCLISFAVMAADKTQGWSGDSFYRYIEYR